MSIGMAQHDGKAVSGAVFEGFSCRNVVFKFFIAHLVAEQQCSVAISSGEVGIAQIRVDDGTLDVCD
jgi:hypothetical protein